MATSYTVTNPINTDGASAVPGASNRALGLKLYSNEVLTAFTRRNMFLEMVKTRTINGGVSSQFIVSGQAADTDAATHTPGTDVAAQVLKVRERTITITDRVYYSHFVDKLDEKLAQYDLRGELAKQAAEALSTKIDKQIAALIVTASETAAIAGVQIGGHVVSMGTTVAFNALTTEQKGDALVEALFDANVAFDSNDVPMDGRVFVTKPQNYAYIVQSQKAVNRDFTNGNGGIDSGNVLNIAGTPIKWSNHLPATATDGASIQGLFFQSGCVGVVKAMDITSESNYLPEKLGDLLTSYYALGMDVLEPGKACRIVTTN